MTSPWIPRPVREPTASDCDKYGRVLLEFHNRYQQAAVVPVSVGLNDYTHWMTPTHPEEAKVETVADVRVWALDDYDKLGRSCKSADYVRHLCDLSERMIDAKLNERKP